MSQENVEVVRALQPPGDLAHFFRDDLTAQAATDVVQQLFDSNVEVVFVQPIEQAVFHGLDGLRSAWLEWLTPWASYRTEAEDFIDQGDRVVVLTRDYALREDSKQRSTSKASPSTTFGTGKSLGSSSISTAPRASKPWGCRSR